MGNALAARLFYSLKKNGVPILFETRAQELLQDNGRTIGVLLLSEGRTLRVKARRGVVIASVPYTYSSPRRSIVAATSPPTRRTAGTATGASK